MPNNKQQKNKKKFGYKQYLLVIAVVFQKFLITLDLSADKVSK